MAKRNRLANEKSPYLLQHAQNPIDWYPWSRAAFRKAVRKDKPVTDIDEVAKMLTSSDREY